jgi:DNA-binding LacI/PurR family transcriptional regulator
MTTMADIAERVGVSVSTVSYVLSGKRRISDETRRRVLEEIQRSNFRPHAVGRALASRRSRTIALLYPTDDIGLTRMLLEFVIGAAEQAGREGYALLVSTSSDEDEHILNMIREGSVDGLIVMEVSLHDPRIDFLKSLGRPFTMIGHCDNNDGLTYVDLDFTQAVEEAVDFLHNLGHRHIALIDRETAEESVGYGPSVRSRAGYRAAIARHRLEGLHYPCGLSAHDGFRATSAVFDDHPEATALIVINTDALGGIYNAIREKNLSIPADVSVIAVTSPRVAEFMVPSLTSVDFPATTMGRMGVEFLVRQVEGGSGTEIEPCLLSSTITVRQSTGPVPAR